MSGPMAASFGLEAAVLISARSIAQGAAEVATGLAEADKQAAMQRRQRSEERQRMRAAQQAGNAKQLRDAASHEAMRRITRLLGGAEMTDGEPLAMRMQALGEQGSSLQAQLAAFLELARATQAADTAAARPVRVAQVLERLELNADEPLPSALEALAQQAIDAPGEARADALVTELRLQVQRHNEVRAAVAEQQQMQEAAALVLEASLRDLGYAVEEIEETLFVDGGVAHFQRPEWGDYFIRLRIDPKRNAMNFNVVRAGTVGDDRKQEDMRAEERWCSEFPILFDTFKARGIPITITRLLQAGEALVQVVDAESLPERPSEAHHHEPLKARSIE